VIIELTPIRAAVLTSPELSVKLLRYQVETPDRAMITRSNSEPSGKLSMESSYT